jgi:hypothetical protein
MKSTKHQKLILSLLRDDLVNQKMVLSMQQIGIDASTYWLYLSGTIFKLMGFKKAQITTELCDLYAQHCYKVLSLDITNSRSEMEPLAQELYEALWAYQRIQDGSLKR